MSADRKYEIVVLGASGYTGKYVIEELAKYTSDITWCVAGRSQKKLEDTLKEVGNISGKNLTGIEIIQVDVHNQDSLRNMCKQAKLVINCVGPYRFTGSKVVDECLNCGTHHVDVSGEPEFLETMQLMHFHSAIQKNVYIVGACGFDSIPCDLGVEYTKEKLGGDVNSIETFLTLNFPKGCVGNFATWQSAIYGIANAASLKSLRKDLCKKIFPKAAAKSNYPLLKRPTVFKNELTNNWCIPFVGSDKSVVSRTQMYNFQYRNQRPVMVQTYLSVSSLFNALALIFMGIIFFIMTRFELGRTVLEKYPELFSFGAFSRSPSPRSTANERSFNIIFKAQGWSETLADPTDKHTEKPNEELIGRITGPDPYIATAICVVNAALVILQEQSKLPENGGVYSPGAVFKETTLMKRLLSRGFTYDIKNSYV